VYRHSDDNRMLVSAKIQDTFAFPMILVSAAHLVFRCWMLEV